MPIPFADPKYAAQLCRAIITDKTRLLRLYRRNGADAWLCFQVQCDISRVWETRRHYQQQARLVPAGGQR